ncbi:MAG: M61 family metallopeptidase [Dokdonella sp.]|uniref:M61 family metallopeptidase n=1 Tax=Dokdonella sp. TaxID=2291710 RepID=UPI003F7FB22F
MPAFPRPAARPLARPLIAATILVVTACSASASRRATPERAPATFEGAIALDVDLTDRRRRIVAVRERIPVQHAGKTVLFYPQWDAASHAPSISAHRLAGLAISADGVPLAWRRDPARVHAFAIEVPAGAKELQAQFQYLAPLGHEASATVFDGFIGLSWNRVLVYPDGWPARQIPLQATITLPEGMTPATSLHGERDGATVRFAPVPLDRLIDAPVFASRHVQARSIAGGAAPVRAQWIAADEAAIGRTAEFDRPLRTVVEEVQALFGPPPFDPYDFLFGLDDRLPGPGGIEHADSGEVFLPTDFLAQRDAAAPWIDVIPHEFIHAWNGLWRVPADMATATPNESATGTLLWIYEGQTEFWSRIIAARAGLRSAQQTLDALALDAAVVQSRAGRRWKSLADSSNDPLIQSGRADWRDWQRREDYYVEGVLFWLDIDARLRRCSDGAKGIDDFAAAFFSAANREHGERYRGYTEGDVVAALGDVCVADWSAILHRKLDAHDDEGVLDGLAAHGWRLVFGDTPSAYFRLAEAADGVLDLNWSIGLTITPSGQVKSVAWEGPAFAAGIVPGARVTTLDGAPFTPEALGQAIASRMRLRLGITFDGGKFAADIDARMGHRYPRLDRIPGASDTLSTLLAKRRRDAD